MSIPKPSEEQQLIIDYALEHSVQVDSVAGSGKTTTALNLALSYPKLSILMLTYSAKLKIESRNKIQSSKIENVEVHSYHSFVVKYYNKLAYTDILLKQTVDSKKERLSSFSYDLFILDEVQDMNPLYYELVHMVQRDNGKKPQFIVIGDVDQCIYKYNGSNPSYLSSASMLFSTSQDWKSAKLSISYRVTDRISTFVNKILLGQERIKAIKSGPVVDYVITDSYNKMKNYNILTVLKKYLESYDHTDIMILASSVRVKKNGGENPVCHLANLISNEGIPIYVPHSDQEKVDTDVFKGKLPFLTFHQSKGLESKVVIVFNFDMSYFLFYDRDGDQTTCPNVFYVACTRALEKLCLIHTSNMAYLPFIDPKKIPYYTNIIGITKNIKQVSFGKKVRTLAVSDLLRSIPVSLAERLESLFTYKVVEKKSKSIVEIESKIKNGAGSLVEDVSDINGTAFAAYYQYLKSGKMVILDRLIADKKVDENMKDRLDILSCSDLLRLANQYNAMMSQYTYKLNQVSYYTWIDKDECSKSGKLTEMMDRLSTSIQTPYGFEYPLSRTYDDSLTLLGNVDCLNKREIWEIKCVKKVRLEHFLQLIVYGSLFKFYQEQQKLIQNPSENTLNLIKEPFKLKLFNILEDIEYHVEVEDTDLITDLLVKNYTNPKEYEEHHSFIKKCLEVKKRYESTELCIENEEDTIEISISNDIETTHDDEFA